MSSVEVRQVCPYCGHTYIAYMNPNSFSPALKPLNRVDCIDYFENKSPCSSVNCPVKNCKCWSQRL